MAAEAPQGKETASGAEQGREDVKRPDSAQGAQADEKTEPKNEPDNARRVHRVLLPHDWLTWRLAGGGPQGSGDPSLEPTTDRGDASGTGYFSPADGTWLPDLAAAALGPPADQDALAGSRRNSGFQYTVSVCEPSGWITRTVAGGSFCTPR